MRIALVHPNYHSGGAEVAGNWPPAGLATQAGPLKASGYHDIHSAADRATRAHTAQGSLRKRETGSTIHAEINDCGGGEQQLQEAIEP